MDSLNSVTVGGNLVADPEMKEIGEMTIAEFRIASTRSRKKGDEWVEETSYFDVTAFSGLTLPWVQLWRTGSVSLGEAGALYLSLAGAVWALIHGAKNMDIMPGGPGGKEIG